MKLDILKSLSALSLVMVISYSVLLGQCKEITINYPQWMKLTHNNTNNDNNCLGKYNYNKGIVPNVVLYSILIIVLYLFNSYKSSNYYQLFTILVILLTIVFSLHLIKISNDSLRLSLFVYNDDIHIRKNSKLLLLFACISLVISVLALTQVIAINLKPTTIMMILTLMTGIASVFYIIIFDSKLSKEMKKGLKRDINWNGILITNSVVFIIFGLLFAFGQLKLKNTPFKNLLMMFFVVMIGLNSYLIYDSNEVLSGTSLLEEKMKVKSSGLTLLKTYSTGILSIASISLVLFLMCIIYFS